MSDETDGLKPWDIERYRGVRRYAERKKDWELGDDDELVLGGGGAGGVAGGSSRGEAQPRYARSGPSLFWLALRGSILTVLTLGIYRFWLVTGLRRHFWNAIRIQGDPFEYTGTGLEKLLGFLLAIVILAIYLGLVNLGLVFIGLSYFEGNPFALQITVLAAIPFLFFAVYRARRYAMARTRWRGIRLGMEPGAWGYTGRALLYWVLTILTLGLLHPLKQFRLTKFMVDRTWFGDLKFQQSGSWVGLFAYWIWLYVVLGLMALAAWGMAADPGNPSTQVIGGLIAFLGYIALFVMFMRYEVVAFRYLWSNRTLGGVRFQNDVSPGQIISVYVVGTLLSGICTLLVIVAFSAGVGVLAYAVLGPGQLDNLGGMIEDPSAALSRTQMIGIAAAAALAYLVAMAFAFAFSQVFITRPILMRKTEAMVIHNAEALSASRQRVHDRATEAGGFADALGVDVGAGF
ncbi:MAG TPA: DUF898 family protein [Thermohalobaculum sp.]|nr:DUF898 family protein [Thermohalobaculum sp.]